MEQFKEWAMATLLKTIRTMAQTATGVIGGSALFSEVDWKVVGSTVLLSGIMTILMNVGQIEVKESQGEN